MQKKKIRLKKNAAKRMSLFFIVVIVILSGFLFAKSSFFSVQKVYVDGFDGLDKQKVIRKSGISIGLNIFSFDADAIQKEICTLPEIESCSIVREYPNTVKIVVTKRVPLMSIFYKNVYYSIDASSKLIEKTKKWDSDKGVVVTGLKKFDTSYDIGDSVKMFSDPFMETVYDTLSSLQKNGLLADVSEVYISPKGIFYIYTQKSNVIKFFTYSAFADNLPFIEKFIKNEERSIMVEVIEGVEPVYKKIKID